MAPVAEPVTASAGSSATGSSAVRLLATDLDGTLLCSDNTVSDATRQALANAADAGLAVVFVTGRPTRWVWEVASATGYAGVVVAANGAMTIDLADETILHSAYLSPTDLLDATDTLRQQFDDVHFAVDFGDSFAYEIGYKFDVTIETIPDRYGTMRRIPEPRALAEIIAQPVVKLLARSDRHEPDAFLAAAAEILGDRAYVTRSATSSLLEISASGVSKAVGLSRHCHRLGIAASEVAAVGDMPNDIPMFDWAGRSYAVANAHPASQAAADVVLPRTNDEDAVAYLIRDLLAEL